MPTLAERCLGIDLLILDVDGVLTPGGILYPGAEGETKIFHVRDGSALRIWNSLGKKSAFVTGRSSPAIGRRAKELGVSFVAQAASDKKAALSDVLRTTGVEAKRACAMGDDLQDLPLLAEVGLAVAVADAALEVALASHYVTRSPGGMGAAREVVEWILRCQGTWRQLSSARNHSG